MTNSGWGALAGLKVIEIDNSGQLEAALAALLAALDPVKA